MTALNHVATPWAQPVVTGWMPGSVDPGERPVMVSVTDYTSSQRRDLPGIAYRGLRMREGWYAMPGAVGMWLWSLPADGRCGSISVWTSSDALQQFITLPRHLDIMARYRDRGSVRSTSWEAEMFIPGETLRRAQDWIVERS
ncbi:hypothetical protein [Mycobacterium sp. OTB74]|uniref:hypothetical protein n=1 Tax=Mycobacterium sp. OTB74 TaxID=1853452 RepID=UPI0024741465|nr:hypothetical protein [Mycobacterium sp. OTB74]MDH6244707.1 hypothetical protein [Mycobacterium sp. OTB74]